MKCSVITESQNLAASPGDSRTPFMNVALAGLPGIQMEQWKKDKDLRLRHRGSAGVFKIVGNNK